MLDWRQAAARGRTVPMLALRFPVSDCLLGHKQVQTTQRYAHLLDDPPRTGLNQVGEMLRPKLRLVEIAP
jgi:hypothetical protein